jgi:phosphoribosyl-AMP cyclohydrolase
LQIKGKDARRGTGGLFCCPTLMNLDFSKLGYMNGEAFRKTTESGNVTFFSRSRNKLWMKGESSGHRLVVKEISTDCDDDSLLIQVESLGPGVCHNGYESCFYRRLEANDWVEKDKPAYDPEAVYGAKT